MASFIHDLRFTLRSLRHRPGFALLAGVTLALGLGANTAIFTIVDGTVLRPLPFRAPDELVHVWPNGSWFSKEMYRFFQENSRSYESMAAYWGWSSYTLTGGDEPVVLQGAEVSGDFFRVLGVEAWVGRTFGAQDAKPGGPRVAVLSYGVWHRLFGGDPAMVGGTVALDDELYTVLGVLPPRFAFPYTVDEIWVPMRFDPADAVDYSSRYLQVVARLHAGTELLQARTEGRRVAAEMAPVLGLREDFGADSTVLSLHSVLVGPVRAGMLALLGAVGFVLLLAAVNVAHLILSRSMARTREMAIRTALGGRRSRQVRLLLTESLCLAVVAGGVGTLGAYLSLDLLVAQLPAVTPRLHEIALNHRVLWVSALLTLLTGLLFGCAPAFKLSRPNLVTCLKEAGRAHATQARSSWRDLLVVSEVALAFVLVVGAGLTLKSFWRLIHVEPGFEVERVLSFLPLATGEAYSDHARTMAFADRLLERLEELPGVEAAAGIHMLPVAMQGFNGGLEIADWPVDRGEEPVVNWRVVTPGYFHAMGISCLEGRLFSQADRAGAPQVALVNRTLARRLWPGQQPLGRLIRNQVEGGEWATVVGVVADVRQRGPGQAVEPEMYRPHGQNQRPVGLGIVVRAAGDPTQLMGPVRQAVGAVDPDVAVINLRTMRQVLAESVNQPRFVMALLSLFAALALLLGAIGIYGVMSYNVSLRTHEIGIRVALGAQANEVVALVMRRALGLIAAGLLLGVLGALALSRTVTSLLFDVQPTDPPTLLSVALVLLGVAALAAYLPARRVLSIDPLTALRYE